MNNGEMARKHEISGSVDKDFLYESYSNRIEELKKLDRRGWGVFLSSAVLCLGGVFLTLLPNVIQFPATSPAKNILENIGNGLIAASILTITLEYQNQKQRYEDISFATRKMQTVTTDKLLEALTGDKKIFEEVKNSVLTQNYIREDFWAQMWLREHPYQNTNDFLFKELEVGYTIKNITSHTIKYKFSIKEEKECEYVSLGNTKITRAAYMLTDCPDNISRNIDDSYQEIETNSNEENKGKEHSSFEIIEVHKEIEIPPHGYANFRFSTESIIEKSKSFPLISLVPSTGLEFELVEHPKDIEIKAKPIHPNLDKFQELTPGKRWEIKTGILPGQGIIITWKPKYQLPDGMWEKYVASQMPDFYSHNSYPIKQESSENTTEN